MKPSTITTTILGLAVVLLGANAIKQNKRVTFFEETLIDQFRHINNGVKSDIAIWKALLKTTEELVEQKQLYVGDRINLYDNQGMFNGKLNDLKERILKLEDESKKRFSSKP